MAAQTGTGARTGTAARKTGTKSRQTAPARSGNEKEAPSTVIEQEVEIEILDLASVNVPVNIILHGPSGVGKTVLAAGAPNAYLLSTEIEGAVSAKRAGQKAKLIPAPDWEHTVSGVKWAEQNLGPEDWLILDSGDRMQVEFWRWILRMEHAANPARSLDILSLQNHQWAQNGFKRWYDRIVRGPYNSIMVCHSMTVQDAEDETWVIPAILGKDGEISSYILAQASVVLYYSVSRESREGETNAIVRRALAQPFPPWTAKDRYDALGEYQDVAEGEYDAMAQFIEMIYEVRDAS